MARFGNEDQYEGIPEDLVSAAFARCTNYPKDRAGVLGISQGLRTASEKYNVSMNAILRECTNTSVFCPTNLEMLNIARSLNPPEETKQENRKCAYDLCDGCGWIQKYALWTWHSQEGGGIWIEKECITFEQYETLNRKITDWNKQMAYEGALRCKCHPAREPEPKKEKKRAA